ncbi:MAG: carbon-nitrogen hydrolase [Gloeomargaritaceae cyanobacterium C42_A2020_066]|nr:carbon-nitrogen hydrolase [Gloeomargaritaceae cyanobacterium C42_A2020_066]
MPTPHRTCTVGLIQMVCEVDPQTNLEQAMALIREAAGRGAQVICLPELFRSPYFCQTEDYDAFQLAEPIPGPSTEALLPLAQELNVVIIASLFERRAAGLYHNTAVVLDGQRGYLGKYRKMHIPDDPLYYEKFYFTPGDLGFKCFATSRAALGVLVCWDQWYPEAARLTALRGAEILFYPTAIGWHPAEKESLGPQQHQAWETLQRAHGIANGCYVVAVNRAGFEPTPNGQGEGLVFWGQSFVSGPDGAVLARGPADQAAVLVVDLDLAAIDRVRTGWPFLRDRRIDAYSDLTQRWLDREGD